MQLPDASQKGIAGRGPAHTPSPARRTDSVSSCGISSAARTGGRRHVHEESGTLLCDLTTETKLVDPTIRANIKACILAGGMRHCDGIGRSVLSGCRSSLVDLAAGGYFKPAAGDAVRFSSCRDD